MKKILVFIFITLLVGALYLGVRAPTRVATPEPLGAGVSPAEPTTRPTDPAPRAQPSPTGTLVPLQISFPSPGPALTTNWRPPVYPVPWSPTEFDHFYLLRPIPSDDVNGQINSYRYGGIFFENVIHTGVDISSPEGTPALASGAGKVIWAGYGLYSGLPDNTDDPYGIAVAIRHDFGYNGKTIYTLYAHLSEAQVTRGQRVEAGQQIGLVGQTGYVTGPHLHFEVRVNDNTFGDSFNPELWLSPPQGWGVLAARIMGTGSQILYNHEVTIINLNTRQTWEVDSYGETTSVNSDPYYRENMVIGDLPAGDYLIEVPYLGRTYSVKMTIYPGRVSYFQFRGTSGFDLSPPPTPVGNFTPPDATATPAQSPTP